MQDSTFVEINNLSKNNNIMYWHNMNIICLMKNNQVMQDFVCQFFFSRYVNLEKERELRVHLSETKIAMGYDVPFFILFSSSVEIQRPCYMMVFRSGYGSNYFRSRNRVWPRFIPLLFYFSTDFSPIIGLSLNVMLFIFSSSFFYDTFCIYRIFK